MPKISPVLASLSRRWSSYKYRFVPWLLLNFRQELAKQDARRAKQVRSEDQDSKEKRLADLADLLARFERPDPKIVFRQAVNVNKYFFLL